MRLLSCFPAALDDNGVIRPREAMDILRPGSAMICTRPVGHERASRRGSDRLFDTEKIFVELQHSTVRVLFRMHGSVRGRKSRLFAKIVSRCNPRRFGSAAVIGKSRRHVKIPPVRENCFGIRAATASVRKRFGFRAAVNMFAKIVSRCKIRNVSDFAKCRFGFAYMFLKL
jgi:hypothetical protein